MQECLSLACFGGCGARVCGTTGGHIGHVYLQPKVGVPAVALGSGCLVADMTKKDGLGSLALIHQCLQTKRFSCELHFTGPD